MFASRSRFICIPMMSKEFFNTQTLTNIGVLLWAHNKNLKTNFYSLPNKLSNYQQRIFWKVVRLSIQYNVKPTQFEAFSNCLEKLLNELASASANILDRCFDCLHDIYVLSSVIIQKTDIISSSSAAVFKQYSLDDFLKRYFLVFQKKKKTGKYWRLMFVF